MLLAIGIGTFMSALDGSVVNTILPVVNLALGSSTASSVATIEWVVTVYLLVLSGLLLSFGRVGDMRGHKMIYISGFAIFLISSALCGLAPSITALIIFRAIQALGAAMLSANSPAILTKNFPAAQRGQALGLQATMTYLGLVTGPSLGGWLAHQFNWRAVFYINIPVGLVALILSQRFIPQDRPKQSAERFDPLGAGLFIFGLVALLLGLNQGHALGWNSPVILALLSAALLLLGAFIAVEHRPSSASAVQTPSESSPLPGWQQPGQRPPPMLDLSLFTNSRTFSIAVASAVLNYICIYAILFLMPFYLIQGRGLSTLQAGFVLTAQPIVMAIVAPISGTLSDRIGARIPTVVGMLGLVVGLVLLASLGMDAPLLAVALSLGIAGFGTGIFISPNTSALMGSAPRHRQGIAAGTLATARNVGMVLGVGLAGAIFTTQLQHPGLPPTQALFAAIHSSFLATAGIATFGTIITAAQDSAKKSMQ